jgi:hypothetical protein
MTGFAGEEEDCRCRIRAGEGRYEQKWPFIASCLLFCVCFLIIHFWPEGKHEQEEEEEEEREKKQKNKMMKKGRKGKIKCKASSDDL